MEDVLSQQEIDSLLSSLITGEVSVASIKEEQELKKVREYDFRRPNRFSNEQIRTLEMMHENFARLLSTFLSAQLRTVVEVHMLSVEELSYGEFIRSVLNPTVIALASVKGLGAQMLIEVNPVLAFNLISRLLGGSGGGKEEYRPLTEIEGIIIKRLLRQVLDILAEAWIYVVPLTSNIDRLETNPQFVQMIADNEMVALISLEVKIDGAQGVLNLCFPYIMLKPVTGRLNARHWFSQTEKEAVPFDSVDLIKERLYSTKVPVIVEMGQTTILTSDLLQLQEGDVILLGDKITNDLNVRIGNKTKFRARPGMLGDRLAVEVTAIRKEGEDFV